MSDESDVRAIEAKRIKGIVEHDRALMESVMDDSLVHVHMSGKIDDKAHAIGGVMNAQFTALERPDLKVTVMGDTAVLFGPLFAHLTRPDGEKVVLKAVGVQVAHKFKDGWKFVHYQVTRDETGK
jgi:ketosteroid isomerase-like protein